MDLIDDSIKWTNTKMRCNECFNSTRGRIQSIPTWIDSHSSKISKRNQSQPTFALYHWKPLVAAPTRLNTLSPLTTIPTLLLRECTLEAISSNFAWTQAKGGRDTFQLGWLVHQRNLRCAKIPLIIHESSLHDEAKAFSCFMAFGREVVSDYTRGPPKVQPIHSYRGNDLE